MADLKTAEYLFKTFENDFKHLSKFLTHIITIASGSIVLTVSFLNNNLIIFPWILIVSWSGFIMAILASVLLHYMGDQVYKPRHPKKSKLWQCLHAHFKEYLNHYKEKHEKNYGYLRPIVGEVVNKDLECGDLSKGFARVVTAYP